MAKATTGQNPGEGRGSRAHALRSSRLVATSAAIDPSGAGSMAEWAGPMTGGEITRALGDNSAAEIEFMQAIRDYKARSGRIFPTWSEVLEILRGLGYVQASPGSGPLDQPDVISLAADVVADSEAWLNTPNAQLGDRAPVSLLGSAEQQKVYDLLFAIDQGLF